MLRELAKPAVVVLLMAPWASAQDDGVSLLHGLDVPVEDLGLFHVAGGTWTSVIELGSAEPATDVYNNTCESGQYVDASGPGVLYVDEGRIPSTSSTSGLTGDRDSYRITHLRIGYATRVPDAEIGGPGAHIVVRVFQSYQPCAPAPLPTTAVGEVELTGLPGTLTGALRAVVFTVELPAMSEFCIRGDGDGAYQANPGLDSFGYALEIRGEVYGPAGFLVAGPVPGGCPVGDGTRWQNPDDAGAGLGNFNFVRRESAAPGCVTFGPGVHAGLYFALGGSVALECSPAGSGFCFGTACPCGNDDPVAGCANSTGEGALLTTAGSNLVGPDDLSLRCTGVPPNTVGIFFVGGGQRLMPFHDGFLCVEPGPFAGGFMRVGLQFALGTGELNLPPGILGRAQGRIRTGVPQHFQAWYRNPSGPCAMRSNTSNGYSVTFQ